MFLFCHRPQWGAGSPTTFNRLKSYEKQSVPQDAAAVVAHGELIINYYSCVRTNAIPTISTSGLFVCLCFFFGGGGEEERCCVSVKYQIKIKKPIELLPHSVKF